MGKDECIDAMDFGTEWKQWRGGLSRRIAQCRSHDMSVKEARNWAEAIAYYLNQTVERGSPEEQLLDDDWHCCYFGRKKNPHERNL